MVKTKIEKQNTSNSLKTTSSNWSILCYISLSVDNLVLFKYACYNLSCLNLFLNYSLLLFWLLNLGLLVGLLAILVVFDFSF